MIYTEWNHYSRTAFNVSFAAGLLGLPEGSVGGFCTASAQLPPGWQQM